MNSIAMTVKEIAPQSCIMNPICGATRPGSCAWGQQTVTPGSGFFLPGVHPEEGAHFLPWGEARASEMLVAPLKCWLHPLFPSALPLSLFSVTAKEKKEKKKKRCELS